MLLHEFDPNPAAMINPSDNHSPIPGCPKVAVSCFERHTFERMAARLETEEIGRASCATIEIPLYRAQYQGKEVALFQSYEGA